MEFRNKVERWHKLREYAEYLAKYTAFHERNAIRDCVHYEFDIQSAEEYCWCPQLRKHHLQTTCLNGESEKICWECPHYEIGGSEEAMNE